MNDPRETACCGAEGEGKNSQAKGSDQDGTSESAMASNFNPKQHTKGASACTGANLSGLDGGRKTRGVFLSLFVPGNLAKVQYAITIPLPSSASRETADDTSPGGGGKGVSLSP